MATHTCLVLRASDGEALDEIPLGDLSVTSVLTGLGTATGSLPLNHPKSIRSLLGPGQGRELAIIRNGTECIFNGPIVRTVRSLDGIVQVQAADPGFYLSRRTTEGPRNYGRPVLSAVNDLVLTAQGVAPRAPKPSGVLYRLTCDPTTGGPVKRWAISSTDRLPILEVIGDLADEDVAGFDWRWEYPYTPAGFLVSRVMRLGAPHLGVNRPDVIVEPPQLQAFEDVEGIDRAANRVHVLGAGTGKGRRRATAQNNASLAAAGVLWEQAVDRSNVTNQATLNGMANAYRRILNPPGRIISTTHRVPELGSLRWGGALLGDSVRIRVFVGTEQLDIVRRVVAQQLSITDDGEEQVAWTYNDPTDEVTS